MLTHKFVSIRFLSDVPSPRLANVCQADQIRSTDYNVKASSVYPIGSSPLSSSTRKSPHGRTAHQFRQNFFPEYQVGVFLCFASLHLFPTERALLFQK